MRCLSTNLVKQKVITVNSLLLDSMLRYKYHYLIYTPRMYCTPRNNLGFQKQKGLSKPFTTRAFLSQSATVYYDTHCQRTRMTKKTLSPSTITILVNGSRTLNDSYECSGCLSFASASPASDVGFLFRCRPERGIRFQKKPF